MRPYTEYVYLTTIAFLLFISYLVITLRADSVDFTINGTTIPNESKADIHQIYIDENCTNGNYATFKENGNFYSSTTKSLLISNLTLPLSNAAAGVIKIGYGDTANSCSTIPTNSIISYIIGAPDIDDMLELELLVDVPPTKFPFIYVSGYNFSAAGVGLEY